MNTQELLGSFFKLFSTSRFWLWINLKEWFSAVSLTANMILLLSWWYRSHFPVVCWGNREIYWCRFGKEVLFHVKLGFLTMSCVTIMNTFKILLELINQFEALLEACPSKIINALFSRSYSPETERLYDRRLLKIEGRANCWIEFKILIRIENFWKRRIKVSRRRKWILRGLSQNYFAFSWCALVFSSHMLYVVSFWTKFDENSNWIGSCTKLQNLDLV